MTRGFKKLRDRIGERVGNKARANLARYTLPHSKTLAGSYVVLHRYRSRTQKVLIRSPYHWAAILDEGRGPSVAEKGKVLVWFRRPQDDPRLRYGYTRRRGRRPKLSRSDFKKWVAINNRLPEGVPKPMIISRYAKGTNPTDFTQKGHPQLRKETIRIFREEIRRFIPEQLASKRDDLKVQKVTIDL